MELNLNLDQSPLNESQRSIGSKYGHMLSTVESKKSPPRFVYRATAPYEALVQTMITLLAWNETAEFISVKLVLVSPVVRGMKQDWMLSVKTHGLNSGVDTKVKRMLSLMNFVEVLTYPTSCVGWIVIQSVWKLREVADPCVPSTSGLPATFRRETGTQTWTPVPWMPC